MTRAQLRAWCERHFGKHREPAAEALGLTLTQLRERLYREGVIEKDRQTAIIAQLYDEVAECRKHIGKGFELVHRG